MSGAPAIEAHGLGKRYGKLSALEDVELTVPRGVILGVLGPSGAGKTSLVRCLALLTRPSAGSLQLFGVGASRASAALRRRIGYMPQEMALYEELSARFNVAFFSRGAKAARIDALLALLGLAERADDPVLEFSGGMKQRVSLACALAREPELLLLDEPTAGIDPLLRLAFWDEFRRLQGEGRTLLVSTHQLDEALHCDLLLVLRQGRVLLLGTPAELLARGGASARLELAGGEVFEARFDAPESELPRWLAGFEMGAVRRLELRQDTLEEILVRLIREAGQDGRS